MSDCMRHLVINSCVRLVETQRHDDWPYYVETLMRLDVVGRKGYVCDTEAAFVAGELAASAVTSGSFFADWSIRNASQN